MPEIKLIERTESEKKAYYEGYKRAFDTFKRYLLHHRQRNLAISKMETIIDIMQKTLFKEGAE